MKTKDLLAALGILLLAVAWVLWRYFGIAASAPSAVVQGGDGGGLPRAQPQQEHIDSTLLDRASTEPAAAGLQALVVMRHGHIVFERYGHGVDADTVIDSGAFANALVALAAGIATQGNTLPAQALNNFDATQLRAAIETVSHQNYPEFLSRRLWSRLNAASASILLPTLGAAAPAGCCFKARLLDWMRVAGLLLDDGRFEGTDIVPRGWVAHMMRPLAADSTQGFGVELASAAHSEQPFATNDVMFLRGPGHWRLWLMPGLKLAVLFGAVSSGSAADAALPSRAWDDTRLPNLVIGAISDAPSPRGGGSLLQQLVPGH